MDFLKRLLYPIDHNYLYHTYIGTIFKIDKGHRISYIYFNVNPTKKFQMLTEKLPLIQKDDRVLINYQEIIDRYISFEIKTIHANLKSNALTVYCLWCGNKLLLSKFKKCNGYIVSRYTWDDMLLKDVYSHDECDSCGDRDYIGSVCRKEIYTCPHCDTERKFEFK